MSTIQEIKDRFPLRETVERYIGDRLAHRTGRADLYYCPFHNDVFNPSFMVKDAYCSCQTGSCMMNGKLWGDVVDFLLEFLHLQKVWQLSEKLSLEEPPKRILPAFKEPDHHLLTWDHVKRGTRHQALAIPFFIGRGVKEPTIHNKYLGVYPSHPNHVRIDGKDYEFRARRYTIPDIAFGQVRKIELRLDHQQAVDDLRLIDQNLIDRVNQTLKAKIGNFPTNDQLAEVFFGGRYTRVSGGVKKELIFNIERLVRRIEHEGTQGWFTPDLPYVLVHEGAFKALAMEDACDTPGYGYPSISCHAAAGLASAIAGVKDVVIVQDNDPDKIRPDGLVVNPGRDYAYRAMEITGRRYGVRIIRPPDEFNGADDVVKAGKVHEWMQSCGIEPIRLTSLRPPG